MRTWLILAAVHAALLAVPAAAQDVPADSTPAETSVLRKGAWALSFTAPGYSAGERGEFGVWEMVGARTALGLTLEVLVRGTDRTEEGPDQTDAFTGVGLGFNVRRYLVPQHRVAPYLLGRMFGRGTYGRAESGGYTSENRAFHAGVDAALGAEWFPVGAFSVAGHTGVRVQSSRHEHEAENPEGERREGTVREGLFQTFTSTLSVQIYF